ncbi:MAG: phosphatase PAP2 family protein [bacterium]|nr:phosphatase PAP2 family protein [bacterium]
MIASIAALDTSVEQALYAVRDPSIVQFFIWLTELGDAYTIIGFTLIAAIILAYAKRWSLAAGLFTSAFGSLLLSYIIKHVVARPRPPAPLYAYVESTQYAFPSTHATLSVAFYAFLVWLIYKKLPIAWRFPLIGLATVLIITIGFSRLYLGVHYPSDVLVGYLLGGIFVMLGITVAKKLERRATSS